MQRLEEENNGSKNMLQEKIPAFMKNNFGLGEVDFQIITWIPVLYQAWELDDWAVLIQTSNHNKILLHTDHGSLIHIENPTEFLTERIDFYQSTVEKSKAALKEIEGD